MNREKSTDEWVQRQQRDFQQWNQKRIVRAESRERFNFWVRMITTGIFFLGILVIFVISIPWLIELYRNDPTIFPRAIAPLKRHALELFLTYAVLFVVGFWAAFKR